MGAVYKIDAAGNESVIYSFAAGGDGNFPSSTLVMDSAGNLYGTTDSGGTHGSGTVFKIDASGNETVLHSFGASGDGATPIAGLIKDKAGNFYGTTDAGGAFGSGTVYKIDGSGNESVLYSFTGGADGSRPDAPLRMDSTGNLYGTTLTGGASGLGTVFELTFP